MIPASMEPPRSCDTFVALPPATAGGCVVFGKNSDRPAEEVQEVIYIPAADHPSGSMVEVNRLLIIGRASLAQLFKIKLD